MTRRPLSLIALITSLILVILLVPIRHSATADMPPTVFKLIPSDGDPGDNFGIVVAIDGDTAIVGARWDDDNGTDSGSAYIFAWDGNTWVQQAKLLANDGAEYDHFGHTAAISGNTVLISANRDDDKGTDSGSAYVFVREGSIWSQQAKLTASDGDAGDHLVGVAIEGNTAVVGAFGADVNGMGDAGSVYVFERDGTTWTEKTKIVAGDPQSGDWFGSETAIDGDTLVANAITEDSETTNSGAAYVFVRADDSWSQQAKLTSGDVCYGCYFGSYLALEGDTLLIGAPIYPEWSVKMGCTYVFERAGTIWTRAQRLQASDEAPNDLFGRFIAMEGDTAVITSFQDDDKGVDSGSAYYFTRTDGTWVEQSKLHAPDEAAGDHFGYSVGLSGGTLIVGAPLQDALGEDSGAAYVFMSNRAPVAEPGGPYLGAVGSPIAFDGNGSSDPDGNSLIFDWNWGDGSVSQDAGASPSHVYTAADIHDVCLTVDDGYLQDTKCTIAVVYDPSAGFVTGGGWIESPEGAYIPDPSLLGEATFGFVSKYKKGATIPTGSTEFQFHAADLNYHSTSYQWLIVTGSNYAKFKGSGTINGEGDYKFMLWAGDGTGDDDADTFRIKIWWEEDETEHVVYDNGMDQEIGGGNIVVHTKK